MKKIHTCSPSMMKADVQLTRVATRRSDFMHFPTQRKAPQSPTLLLSKTQLWT